MMFLKRIAGLTCVLLAIILGLFVLVGSLSDNRSGGYGIVVFLGGVAVFLLLFGIRWIWLNQPSRQPSVENKNQIGGRKPAKSKTRRGYDDFVFGDPPPTHKQFGYAMSLGADIQDGMTKWMISDSIDEAIERQRSNEPATKEQLQEIQRYHGVLPRKITRGEARRIIEFLEEYSLPCPFCGIEIIAIDDVCCACNKSLRKMKIPISVN